MSDLAKTNTGLSTKQYFSQPGVQSKFKELLGDRSVAFVTSVLQAVSANPMLASADPVSIYNSAAVAAIINLPINQSIGHAYIVPYNNKQKDGSYRVTAQFQIGYKGLIQLAMRSGQFVRINATEVKEGEIKSRDRKTGQLEFGWIQDDKEREGKKTIGYLSYFKLSNGFESEFYMSTEEIQAHAKKYSQSYKSGFGQWKDNFDKMALKTVTKLHLNSGEAPLSVEMQKAIKADQAVLQDDEGEDAQYADHEEVKVDEELSRISEWIENSKKEDDLQMAIDSYEGDLPVEIVALINKKRLSFNK